MHHDHGLRESIMRGAMGGLVASMAMIPMMKFIMQGMGGAREPFPKRVEKNFARRLGIERRTSETTDTMASMFAHMMFGTFWGAVFGFTKHQLRMPTFPFAQMFGFMVYAFNFLTWVPSLRIVSLPWNQRSPLWWMRIMAHVYYGTVMGLIYKNSASWFHGMFETAEHRAEEMIERTERTGYRVA